MPCIHRGFAFIVATILSFAVIPSAAAIDRAVVCIFNETPIDLAFDMNVGADYWRGGGKIRNVEVKHESGVRVIVRFTDYRPRKMVVWWTRFRAKVTSKRLRFRPSGLSPTFPVRSSSCTPSTTIVITRYAFTHGTNVHRVDYVRGRDCCALPIRQAVYRAHYRQR